MPNRKPLVLAIAAAGLCMAGSAAANGGPDVFSDFCGTTITAAGTAINCEGNWETLTEDCKISIDAGANLSINQCFVNADGYKLEIEGDTAVAGGVNFSGNGGIYGASKIDIDMEGYDPDVYEGICNNTVIYAYDYDFEAVGTGPQDGKITMSADCGSITIYLADQGTPDDVISGDTMVSMKTEDGNITIYGFGGNAVLSGEDGSIKLTAGGEGTVTVNHDVALMAGEIKITSDGGSSEVEGSPKP